MHSFDMVCALCLLVPIKVHMRHAQPLINHFALTCSLLQVDHNRILRIKILLCPTANPPCNDHSKYLLESEGA